MLKSAALAVLLSSTLFAASGCVPVGLAAGAAATTGIAAGQEGGLKSAVSDTGIRARINDYWFRYDTEMFSKVNLTVDQGRVLLTGVVQKPEHRVEAVRLAWQAQGVKQVINEIQVGNQQSFGSYAKDKWITGQLKTQMVFYKDIQSINYSVDTVQGVVYLMGVAADQKELNRVIRLAQHTKGVKQVVSYVKMLGEKIVPSAKGTEITPNGTTTVPDTAMPSTGVSQYGTVPVAPPANVYQGTTTTTTTTSGAPLTPSKSDIQSEVLPP